jgi:septal ring factor EnvC (AmiA/AmiB activator)
MDELSKRNFAAIQQSINGLSNKLAEETQKRMALESQVQMLNQQQNEMIKQISLLQIKRYGAGPTS